MRRQLATKCNQIISPKNPNKFLHHIFVQAHTMDRFMEVDNLTRLFYDQNQIPRTVSKKMH